MIKTFKLTNRKEGFEPIYKIEKQIETVKKLFSVEVKLDELELVSNGTCKNSFLVVATLKDAEGRMLAPEATLLPNRIFSGTVQPKLIGFRKLNSTNYSVTIQTPTVIPLVWMDLSDNFKLSQNSFLYYFEENGFAMVSPEKTVSLYVFFNPHKIDVSKEEIVIKII